MLRGCGERLCLTNFIVLFFMTQCPGVWPYRLISSLHRVLAEKNTLFIAMLKEKKSDCTFIEKKLLSPKNPICWRILTKW